jgi:hypothetical protein
LQKAHIKNYFSKMQNVVSKNAEFDADFKFLEKLQKSHVKKVISEKETEKWSF